MKVAVIQHDIVWEDRDATLARIEPRVAAAFDGGAELVVLPEMFAVGFSMEPNRVAEAEGGPTSTWLAEQASGRGWIGGSVPEKRGGERPRNVFVLAGPAGERIRYAKLHPFTHSGEHEHYDAGTELITVPLTDVRASLFVCYDLRFGDEFWERADRTDLYVVVANWPSARAAHWRALLVARAIENQAWVVGCNRVGEGGGVAYAGGSVIVDPWGNVVADAGAEEAVITADVDAAEVTRVRQRYPFLSDRKRTSSSTS
jgi:predicted amidohydrolase